MPPSIGDTGKVEITRFSPAGNAHVQLDDGNHLNIGCIDCEVGELVYVKRLDQKYCRCLDGNVHKDNYLSRLSRMRQHDDKVNSNKHKITETRSAKKETASSQTSKLEKVPLNKNQVENKNDLINGPI